MFTTSTRIQSFALLLLISLGVFPGISTASAAQEITWGRSNFPPIAIAQGPFKHQGTSDKFIQYLSDQLPGYQHATLDANITRILHQIRNSENTCANVLKTGERAAQMHFSMPLTLVATHSIYYLSSNSRLQLAVDNLQKNSSAVSLQSLLSQHPEFTMGIVESRSYGTRRDKIISQHKDAIVFRGGDRQSLALIKMLINKRVDYIIEYPWTITYEQATQDMPAPLTSASIAESNKHLYSYIACPKTPWGAAVIKDINEVIMRQRNTPEYRQIAESWLRENDLPSFRENYKTLLEFTE